MDGMFKNLNVAMNQNQQAQSYNQQAQAHNQEA